MMKRARSRQRGPASKKARTEPLPLALFDLPIEMRDIVRAFLDDPQQPWHRVALQRTCRALYNEDPGLILPPTLRPFRAELPVDHPAFMWWLRDLMAARIFYAPPMTRVVNLKATGAQERRFHFIAGPAKLTFNLAMEWVLASGEVILMGASDNSDGMVVDYRIPFRKFNERGHVMVQSFRVGAIRRQPFPTSLFWQWNRLDPPPVDGKRDTQYRPWPCCASTARGWCLCELLRSSSLKSSKDAVYDT